MNRKTPVDICYFAVKDRAYPRQRSVAAYFKEEHQANVHVVEIDPARGFLHNAYSLIRATLHNKKSFDAVILAEFSLQFSLIAYVFARKSGAVLVVDWFIGLYETRIEDYSSHSKHSPKAVAFRIVDAISARIGDLTFTDTRPRAKMLAGKYRLKSIPLTVPVGAPDWAQYVPLPESRCGVLKILYYGNYIPLHGLELVVQSILSSNDIDVEMTLIGNGSLRQKIESQVRSSQSRHSFIFIDHVDEKKLSEYIAAHDVVLGVFGSSSKARTVVANKVWQGLASGRRVITQKTIALDGVREHFPGLLYEVEASRDAITSSLSAMVDAPPVPESTAMNAATTVKALVSKGMQALHTEIAVLLQDRS